MVMGFILFTSQVNATFNNILPCDDFPFLCATPPPCDCDEPSPSPRPSPSPNPSPTPSTPPRGGPGGSDDGGGSSDTRSCPVTGLPQKVNQIWFSNISSNSVTVHWENKGDATGYHIAYGLEAGNWLWGVKVGNVHQFTLSDLPTSNIWVSIIPLGSDDCPGEQSSAVQVSGVGPQVLGATGAASNLSLLMAGFGVIGLGLLQAQRVIRRHSKV